MGVRDAIYIRTAFPADPDPNTLLPGFPTGASGMNGSIEGVPFRTKETYKNANSSALLAAMARSPTGISACNFSVWALDKGYSPNGVPNWVLMDKKTVAEGAPQVINNVRGADQDIYIQINSASGIGATGALLIFQIPQP